MNIKRKKAFNAKSILSKSDIDAQHIEIDDELRREIQAVILSIYKDVKAVCDKYGLLLFLSGGSALGAVRHQGFIPWDDDMDLTMTRTDYNAFERIFEKELSDKYVLMAPGYKNGSRSRFPKVLKKGTVFREIGIHAPDEECGIFLDIFILDNVPDNKILKLTKGTICNVLEFIAGQVLWNEGNAEEVLIAYKKADKKQYWIRRITGKVFSFKSAKDWNRLIDKVIQYDKETGNCTHATGRKHYFGEILPKEVFLPGTQARFENQDVLLFSDPDTYLKKMYGDYMRIPDESEREQHFVEELKL